MQGQSYEVAWGGVGLTKASDFHTPAAPQVTSLLLVCFVYFWGFFVVVFFTCISDKMIGLDFVLHVNKSLKKKTGRDGRNKPDVAVLTFHGSLEDMETVRQLHGYT